MGGTLPPGIKGEAAIDWSDKRARTALLAGIVADADRLLELSRQAQGELAENGEERQQIVAAELLGQLLLQDVERAEGGVSLKDGVSRDRMMSAHQELDRFLRAVWLECCGHVSHFEIGDAVYSTLVPMPGERWRMDPMDEREARWHHMGKSVNAAIPRLPGSGTSKTTAVPPS